MGELTTVPGAATVVAPSPFSDRIAWVEVAPVGRMDHSVPASCDAGITTGWLEAHSMSGVVPSVGDILVLTSSAHLVHYCSQNLYTGQAVRFRSEEHTV